MGGTLPETLSHKETVWDQDGGGGSGPALGTCRPSALTMKLLSSRGEPPRAGDLVVSGWSRVILA